MPNHNSHMTVLPQDIFAEESLLCSVLCKLTKFDDIQHQLLAQDFYKIAHQKLYQGFVDLASRSQEIELSTLVSYLQSKDILEEIGGLSTLLQITDNAAPSMDIAYTIKVIREKSILRQLVFAGQEIINQCSQTAIADAKEVLDHATSAIFHIVEKEIKADFKMLPDVFNQSINEYEKQSDEKRYAGISSGFKGIDKLILGMQKKDLIILAARPSMGKTAYALNIALNVALAGHKVGIFSLEMSTEQLMTRVNSSLAHINSITLKNKKLLKTDWEKLSNISQIVERLSIAIDDNQGVSALDIRTKARQMARHNGGLDLIVIDYLQLIKPSRKADRKDLEVTETTNAIKELAKELDIPILLLSQLNREVEKRPDKRPIAGDLRDSGGIEQIGDIIMMMYRDEMYNKFPQNPNKGIAEVLIRKNRNGETGTVRLFFHGQYTLFEDF
jgi:replicative DNA helicase